MGRPKKYNPLRLRRAVDAYFTSISRTVTAKEPVDTGRRDDKGHVVYDYIDICNDNGEPIRHIEYVFPPTVGGLCQFLGIHRSTWADYCEQEEFSDTTTRARGRMRAYLEEQLLTRKDVRGVIFDLMNNYGLSDKRQMELGPRAGRALTAASVPLSEREDMLRELMEELRAGDDAGAGEN